MFAIIACIDQNRGLGCSGELLFHLKDDLKFFKNTTLGHPVIMGRKTWASLPRKLPDRQNIVVSRTLEAPEKPRATPVTTKAPSFLRPTPDLIISDLPKFLSEHADDSEAYFIIGGASLYEQALPYADILYLTEVATTRPADTFFPKFDKSAYSQHLIAKETENGVTFTISRYTKN